MRGHRGHDSHYGKHRWLYMSGINYWGVLLWIVYIILLCVGYTSMVVAAVPIVSMPDGASLTRQRLTAGAVGWHWYNEPLHLPPPYDPTPQTQSSHALQQRFNQLSPVQQLTVLQAATTQRRVKAVLSGNTEDIAAYKQAQDFWVRRATAFTVGWEKMLLHYPDLDYSLRYSHHNLLSPMMQTERHQAEDRAIQQLGKTHGLLFFYRGGVAEDRLFSHIVRRFVTQHHLTVLPVCVDGIPTADFPESRLDPHSIKARAMGVQVVPALLLVNVATQQYQPVIYGVQSESDLAVRFRRLANHWQPGF